MHRWTLLATLAVVAACGDKDTATPTTTASTQGDATNGEATTTHAGNSDTSATATGASDPNTTDANLPGTDTSASGTTTTTTASPTAPDSAGPDPTETAFIVPMTDEGGPADPTHESDPSGGGVYGECGWSSQNLYYDCSYNGGTPSAVDPSNQDPIDCPDGLMENGPCSEQGGPVKNVGCCDPGGTLYYCTGDGNVIVKEECGA